MSVRSVTFMRNALISKGILPAIRPVARAPIVRVKSVFGTKHTTIGRFYTTAGKHQTSKISSMASSPEIIQAAKAEPKPSKLKELTKKYGAVGIIVYLGVGCVDLGVALGVIQLVGLEKVKQLEKGVLEVVYSTGENFGISKKQPIETGENTMVTSEGSVTTEDDTPSFASVFILAYGIHKTLFLPIRLGITAAITPAIVRKLHQMGWARYFPRLLGASAPKKP
jgi:hypothetical protein